MNHKPKQGGRMIWLDQIRRPICLLCMSHFSVPTFGKHLLTLAWVVIFRSDKCATRGGLDIRLTAEVLDYSFTALLSAVVTWKVLPYFFTAVESQLGERQDWSHLIHGGFCENHLICTVLYSTANDPETANDPQNGPQMILDRKWSPKSHFLRLLLP